MCVCVYVCMCVCAHNIGILLFLWHTVILYQVNETVKKQISLKVYLVKIVIDIVQVLMCSLRTL